MTQVAFSHRPQAGISVGVAVIDGTAWLSATFLDPLDTFSKPYARRRIAGRIERTANGSRRDFTFGKKHQRVQRPVTFYSIYVISSSQTQKKTTLRLPLVTSSLALTHANSCRVMSLGNLL